MRIDDYVGSPAESGYRSIHVVVSRDDHLVEVQLRTRLQHRWAVIVERMEESTGARLRDGKGPREVLRRIHALAEAFDHVERGLEIPSWIKQLFPGET